MRALIVGAGIGGLTAALCLHRAGWQVSVFERATEISAVGAGIQISPNAVHVVRALGLFEDLDAVSFTPQRLEMRAGSDGRQVFSIEMQSTARQRWGAPYWHVHRADLINCLLERLNKLIPGAIHTGCHVVHYAVHKNSPVNQTSKAVLSESPFADNQHESQQAPVLLTLANGEQHAGDLLIGADGIHSIVRNQLLSELKRSNELPTFTGNVAYRAVVPVARLTPHAPRPTACVWVGSGKHAVTYRLGDGTLANFVGVVEQDNWQEESWTQTCDKATVLNHFKDWHPSIVSIIEEAEHHYAWALFDRDVLPTWSSDQVVLLGDACHPMLPFLAQGACMAIEDAWVLGDQMKKVKNGTLDLSEALQRYVAKRLPRVVRVNAAARRNQRNFHMSASPSRGAGHLMLRLADKYAPSRIHANVDWLYGYDVTRSE